MRSTTRSSVCAILPRRVFLALAILLQIGATWLKRKQHVHRLLAEGRLKLKRHVTNPGRIVFHDSCYMGRHNGVYDAPREAIARATGLQPVEMERRRNNSFCCGAGGGRMWMEEALGSRINLARVREALTGKPDSVCVICPYCMTMFKGGLKDESAGDVRVRDIAEVLAEGLREP